MPADTSNQIPIANLSYYEFIFTAVSYQHKYYPVRRLLPVKQRVRNNCAAVQL